jgi:hypothetical protein
VLRKARASRFQVCASRAGRASGRDMLFWLRALCLLRLGEGFVVQPASICSQCARGQRALVAVAPEGDEVTVGARIIARADVLEYGIVRAQSYELQRVYYQGVVGSNVTRVDVESLESPLPAGCAGFTKYIVLFNPNYHRDTGPVIVRPDEVLMVPLWDEIKDSAWLALPGFFWVWLAYSFYQYGEKTGWL